MTIADMLHFASNKCPLSMDAVWPRVMRIFRNENGYVENDGDDPEPMSMRLNQWLSVELN